MGSSYLHAVKNSAISIAKPPSPMNAMHCRSGWAICAAMLYGRAGAIEARFAQSMN
jgi:hypothetical protein